MCQNFTSENQTVRIKNIKLGSTERTYVLNVVYTCIDFFHTLALSHSEVLSMLWSRASHVLKDKFRKSCTRGASCLEYVVHNARKKGENATAIWDKLAKKRFHLAWRRCWKESGQRCIALTPGPALWISVWPQVRHHGWAYSFLYLHNAGNKYPPQLMNSYRLCHRRSTTHQSLIKDQILQESGVLWPYGYILYVMWHPVTGLL